MKEGLSQFSRKPNRLRAWLSILLSIVGVLGLQGCSEMGDSEPKETIKVPRGYRGKANTDPFLAAQRLVQKMGRDASSRRIVSPITSISDTLIVPSLAAQSSGVVKELDTWITSGGHVVYLVSNADRSKNDFNESIFDEAEPDKHPLLEKYSVEVINGASQVDSITVEGREFRCNISVGKRLDIRNVPRRYLSHSDSRTRTTAFASLTIGNGRLSIMADATPWRNPFIGPVPEALKKYNEWDEIYKREHDHASLFMAVASLENDYGDVIIVTGSSTGFWSLLLHYGWVALIAFVVLLLAWLWKNLIRFGPITDVRKDESRDFKEHVEVAGQFLWSRKRSDILLNAARRRIAAGFKRLHATREVNTPESAEILSSLSGLSSDRINTALTIQAVKDPSEMVRIMRDLQTIESSL